MKQTEKQRAYQANYRAAHREQRREYDALYVSAHLPQLAASHAAWRAAHPETARTYQARYRNTHHEQVLAASESWRKTHRDRAHEYHARRSALSRAAFIEDVKIGYLVARDHGRCGICGKAVAVSDRSIDHILPLSRGGQHSYANTRLTHRRCNSARAHRGSAQLRMVG